MTKAQKVHGLTGRPGNRLGKVTAEPSSRRSMYLTDAKWRALEVAAEAEDTSVNKLLRKIIDDYLARHRTRKVAK